MPWFQRGGKFVAGDEKDDDIEFKPEEFKKDISATVAAELAKLEAKRTEDMKPINDMVAAINADREAKNAAAAKAAADKKREDSQISDEDFLLDPGGTIDRKLQGTHNAVYMLAAKQARTEVLGEREYYYGDVKNEVDKMIQAQPLSKQSDVSLIENCYKLVMYDKQKDIADGKLKARNNAASFTSSGTGAPSGDVKNEGSDDWSKDEEEVARNMGINKTDWVKSRRELTYV